MDRVTVVAYCPEWPELYRTEAERLRQALGDELVALAHIGSTAVPGLAAKPVIDILAGLRTGDVSHEAAAGLRALGYVSRRRTRGRHFRKGVPRTYVIHICAYGDGEWRSKIAFRDYLRADRRAAAAYAEHKRALAAGATRAGYQRRKAQFIRELEASLDYERFTARQAKSPPL